MTVNLLIERFEMSVYYYYYYYIRQQDSSRLKTALDSTEHVADLISSVLQSVLERKQIVVIVNV